ncbi:MAG: MBOAT family protein [Lachnospiraceae bacterium]|nr:MBOAT family protein [Lachnospiraceae bacterium]
MDFVSVTYLGFLLLALIIFYTIPKSKQWISLLVFSILFYLSFSLKTWIILLVACGISYYYVTYAKRSRSGLILSVVLILSLMLCFKLCASDLGFVVNLGLTRFAVLLPVGISFYSLQMIAYMIDVYRGKTKAEKSFAKHLLFFLFFPQILQGPIPRFDTLAPQIFGGHDFDEKNLRKGFYLLIWGYFQKMVIADRCNIVVNQIFDNYLLYDGFYVLLAGILYSLQLYTDFAGCVYIAMGSAKMFGIQLDANFKAPYFSVSIKDFWHRWHITLSTFLRDYVYIPLGGNRKGVVRKYVNIMVTFFVSGIWHGLGNHFILWGLMHGAYQVLGQIFAPVFAFLSKKTGISSERGLGRAFAVVRTDFLVMIAWIVFRAKSISQAIMMIKNMFSHFNPWIFFNGDLLTLGIGEKEWGLLVLSVCLLILVGLVHEKKVYFTSVFVKEPLLLRWFVLIAFLMVILITGIYGPGYDATQFIYGGF